MRFEDVDWGKWRPRDRATALFVIRDGELLLIHKKRGFGAGKILGPGGRIEPGETSEQGACREVMEEVGVRPIEVRRHGELSFQFTDGYALSVTVFAASGCQGEPCETEEALPFWTPFERIPYDRMWADDRLWLPLLLGGLDFQGQFLFRDDAMVGWRLEASI